MIVITATDIRLRGYATLVDVLRDLPGMETIQYFFSEFGTQVPVHGIAGNNKIIVLVNGMRVNPPGGENFPFRSDFSVRDAERIEVIYGPGSTLYGADAISAVINVITKQPTAAMHGEVGGDGGLNNARDGWGTFGKVFDQQHGVALSGYVQYHDSDLTPLDEEFRNYWAEYRNIAITKTNANGVVPSREDFGLNAFARLEGYNSSVQVWYRESERSSAEGFSPILGFTPQARWGDWSLVAEGKNTLPISNEMKLDSTITYNRYEIGPQAQYVFPATATTWFLGDHKAGVGQGLTLEETLHVEVNDRLSLLAGFMAGMNDIVPKFTEPSGPNDADFIYYDTTGEHLIPKEVRVTYQTYAGYVEGGWRVLEPLKLIAGVRVTGDTRFTDIPVTPRAAVIYDVTEQITAKYIFTQAYVAPSPYAGFATFDNGAVLNTSNANLKPEKALSNEINLTYHKKKYTLGLSGYYGRQDDLIIIGDRNLPGINQIEPVTVPGGGLRELVHTANGGSSHNVGVDFYGRATFGPVSPWFSFSWVDFQQTTGSITSGLPGISQYNGRAGATWAVTLKFFVTPSLVIRSTPEGVTDPAGLQNELNIPYEFDLYLLFVVNKYVELFADFRNITDHHYALVGFVGAAIPQETFNGVMGVRVRF